MTSGYDFRNGQASRGHLLKRDPMQFRVPVVRLSATSCILLLGLDLAIAESREAIVGKWAIGSKCAAPLSTIVIEPMALAGEDFYCGFSKVKRNGDTVQWQGRGTFRGND